jgi:hypothetical protein
MQPDPTGGVEETKQATSSSSRSGTSSGEEFIPDEPSSPGIDTSPVLTRSRRAALTLDTGTAEADQPPIIVEEGQQEESAEAQIQDPDIDTIFRPLEEITEEETIEFEQTEEEVIDPSNTSVADFLTELTGLFGTPRPVSPQQQQQEEEDYVFTETPLQGEQGAPLEQETEP